MKVCPEGGRNQWDQNGVRKPRKEFAKKVKWEKAKSGQRGFLEKGWMKLERISVI